MQPEAARAGSHKHLETITMTQCIEVPDIRKSQIKQTSLKIYSVRAWSFVVVFFSLRMRTAAFRTIPGFTQFLLFFSFAPHPSQVRYCIEPRDDSRLLRKKVHRRYRLIMRSRKKAIEQRTTCIRLVKATGDEQKHDRTQRRRNKWRRSENV